ncbi:MFS transporter [Rhizobium sp. CFBP 8762]|uniref:MFS transporter n=1 Tax=Rhizobium sp. CFBP 8762 TaxID=2775279 RepID=UPI001782DEC2|nr:MFS transporter [Rhizobium sp. CFBP 8762]MBD8553851.1 MFS transporter [Rhizobium sp. CFBP 8762]
MVEDRLVLGRRGFGLFLIAFAHLIMAIDFTIVYVALPQIGIDLGFSENGLQWVMHGYTVVFGGFLLLGGRASDLLGRRRVFIGALVLFAAASLLGGLATSPTLIVLARAVQGLGAALLFPSTVALVNVLFAEGPERVRALGIWALFGSCGLTLGSLIGGVLVSLFGWPSVFLVNVPLCLLTAAGALLAIPVDRPSHAQRSFDLPGALTATVGATLLVYTIVHAGQAGWATPSTAVLALLAVFALLAFVRIEARGRDPLMPLRFLKSRNLCVGMALTALYMGTFFALPYFETLLFQDAFGYSPMQTGLAFLLPCIVQAAGTQIGTRMTNRLGVKPTIIVGFVIGAAGTALIAAWLVPGAGYVDLIVGLLIGSLGQGIAWGPIWIAVGSDIADEEQGVASAMASTTFQVGGAVGLALLIAVSSFFVHPGTTGAEAMILGIRYAIAAAACAALVGAVLALLLRPQRTPTQTVPLTEF